MLVLAHSSRDFQDLSFVVFCGGTEPEPVFPLEEVTAAEVPRSFWHSASGWELCTLTPMSPATALSLVTR